MNINYHGEGGIFALLCRLDTSTLQPRLRTLFYIVAIFGKYLQIL
jgi:hypothetical protein